jgi:hypothetical protein
MRQLGCARGPPPFARAPGIIALNARRTAEVDSAQATSWSVVNVCAGFLAPNCVSLPRVAGLYLIEAVSVWLAIAQPKPADSLRSATW